MGADVVELLVPPEAVLFRRAPPMTVGIAVVIEVLLYDGAELFAFNFFVECHGLEELAVASISAFL